MEIEREREKEKGEREREIEKMGKREGREKSNVFHWGRLCKDIS